MTTSDDLGKTPLDDRGRLPCSMAKSDIYRVHLWYRARLWPLPEGDLDRDI